MTSWSTLNLPPPERLRKDILSIDVIASPYAATTPTGRARRAARRGLRRVGASGERSAGPGAGRIQRGVGACDDRDAARRGAQLLRAPAPPARIEPRAARSARRRDHDSARRL